MNAYTPDRWEVVKLTVGNETIHKILGSWYGGYGGADSWRMSSGITKVIDQGKSYEVHNVSGSVYTLYKNSQGMSGYTVRVYEDFLRNLGETKAGTMQLVNIRDLIKEEE